MRCPLTPELWQHYLDTGDHQMADHLASCAVCRTEADRFGRLKEALVSIPECDVPVSLSDSIHHLHTQVGDQSLTCRETLQSLEAWREGETDTVRSFLIEDHLLWCASCAAELAQADLLTETLRILPEIEVPAIIAERLEQARTPWWQKLLPMPAPSLIYQMRAAASLAAGIVLAVGLTFVSQRAAQTPFATSRQQAPIVRHVEVNRVHTGDVVASVKDIVIKQTRTTPAVHSQASISAPRIAQRSHRRHHILRHRDEQVPQQSQDVLPDKTDVTPTGNDILVANAAVPVKDPVNAPNADTAHIVVASGESSVEYSAERDMVAKALDERMTEIDDLTAAASEQVRRDVGRPRWTSLSSSL